MYVKMFLVLFWQLLITSTFMLIIYLKT